MSGIVRDADIELLVPINLDELLTTADLQTRRDRKYLVPRALLPELIGQVSDARVLTIDGARSFDYESVYFDTPERTSYLGAARRRPRRFKARTRSYLDSELCMLEVKTRDARELTVKHRVPYDFDDRYHLTVAGRQFIASIDQSAAVADELELALITTYRRTTLVHGDGSARITIDVDVTWIEEDDRNAKLCEWALVETKTPGAPCPFDRALWHRHLRPTVISKYGTGLAALNAVLPANKWHRVLSRHFGQPDRDAANTGTDSVT
jgi:VTC domain